MTRSLLTTIRNLQRRGARRRTNTAVAEGVRLVEEALAAHVVIEGVAFGPALARSERGSKLLASLEEQGVRLEAVSEREIRDAADTDGPQGVLAVIEHPQWKVDDIGDRSAKPVLVLDAVQDPGNAGALIRTARALGATAALVLPGSASMTHPKVIRAGMGATFVFPTVSLPLGVLKEWLVDRSVVLWAAAAHGESVCDIRPPERLALAVGNEGAGLGDGIRKLAERHVCVPMVGGAESLNVAVAAGILLHEVIHNA